MNEVKVVDIRKLGFFKRCFAEKRTDWEPRTVINFTYFDVICVILGSTIYVLEVKPNGLGARKALEAYGIQSQLSGSDPYTKSGEVGQET